MKEGIKEQNNQNQELLLRLQEGDKEAFTNLYYAYKDKLFGFAMSITNSSTKAEDIVQDVFLKIWKNRSSIAEVENINAFIFRVAQNQIIDELRKFAKEQLTFSSADYIINKEDGDANPIEDLMKKEVREKIEEAINLLPPQQKRIYTLHNDKGYKYEEIASELNLSVSTIRNHMSQAINNIRKQLLYNYPNLFIYWIFLFSINFF